MNISSIFQQMLILFLTIGVGYLAVKLKLVDAAFSKGLSRILVNFTTPAMILNSVLASEKVLPNRQVLLLTLLAIGSFAALILIALPLPKLLGVPNKQRNVYRFLTVFNNVGFMGFPVAEAIFGMDAVFFVAIFQIPFNLLCFTYGTWLISDGRAGFSLKNFFLYSLSAEFPGAGLSRESDRFPRTRHFSRRHASGWICPRRRSPERRLLGLAHVSALRS